MLRGVVFLILIFNNLHFKIIANIKKSEGNKNPKTIKLNTKKPKPSCKNKKTQKIAIQKKSAGVIFSKGKCKNKYFSSAEI